MTDIPKKLVADVTAGTHAYVDMTPEEIQQHELDMARFAEELAAREAEQAAKDALKASAKAKLVAGEPLTQEEADTLVI